MTFRILIAEPDGFSPRVVEKLRETAHVDLRACDRAALREAAGAYDVVWFRLAHRIDAELLGPSPRCKVIATPVTGIDHIDVDACRARGIRIVCLKGETEFLKTVRATAELTIALTLALLRHVPAASASVQAGVWNRDLFRGNELYGKTAGVVGLGRLGTIVAGYFRAFGMHVVGYDPRLDFPGDAATRVGTLSELLAASDIVSLHVSYDATTRHLVGARELAQMKPGALLVNTSRGGILDEAALLRALESGPLGGAALDVLDGEPHITRAHPVVAALPHPRLLVVPHIGGNTFESFEKTEAFLAGRVLEALASPKEPS